MNLTEDHMNCVDNTTIDKQGNRFLDVFFFAVTISGMCCRAVLLYLAIHHCLCYCTLFELCTTFRLILFLDPLVFLFVVNRIFFDFPITLLKINVKPFGLALFLNASSDLELLYSF